MFSSRLPTGLFASLQLYSCLLTGSYYLSVFSTYWGVFIFMPRSRSWADTWGRGGWSPHPLLRLFRSPILSNCTLPPMPHWSRASFSTMSLSKFTKILFFNHWYEAISAPQMWRSVRPCYGSPFHSLQTPLSIPKGLLMSPCRCSHLL